MPSSPVAPMWCRRERRLAERNQTGDEGFSMVVIVLTLLVSAGLTALLLGTMLNSNSGANSSTSVTNAPGVAMADDTQAQQNLSQASSAATGAAAASGGYGSLDASALSAAEPSLSFVDGASSSPSTVSVTGGAGGVTLADRSSDGTCWLIWRDGSGTTWYGAQTDVSSCTAPSLGGPPSPGPVSSSAIGWQQGSYPTP
jgi:hypothetical protein